VIICDEVEQPHSIPRSAKKAEMQKKAFMTFPTKKMYFYAHANTRITKDSCLVRQRRGFECASYEVITFRAV
jgi:hypothetical protein